MNKLQIFKNEKFGEIRVTIKNGEPWFVVNDACRILEISNPRDALARLDDDEKDDVGLTDAIGRIQKTNVVNEPGLYSLVLGSRKPEAKEFKRWLTHEVIPTIRKTGTYSINPVANIKQQEAEARLRNARSREANMYYKLAEKYPNNPLYQQVLHSKATEALAGRALIPLPEVEERLYSATEMGKKLGLSKNMIGRISEKYSLKTEQWGKWHEDVSPHNGKEVQTFRYKAAAIEKFQQCWEFEQQERQKSKPLEVVKGGATQ